jgi:hypothetical protein
MTCLLTCACPQHGRRDSADGCDAQHFPEWRGCCCCQSRSSRSAVQRQCEMPRARRDSLDKLMVTNRYNSTLRITPAACLPLPSPVAPSSCLDCGLSTLDMGAAQVDS